MEEGFAKRVKAPSAKWSFAECLKEQSRGPGEKYEGRQTVKEAESVIVGAGL